MQMIKKIMVGFGLVVAVQSAWFVGTPFLYGAGLSEQEKFQQTLQAIMQKGAFDPDKDAAILKSFITSSEASVGPLFSQIDERELFNNFEKAATITFTENGTSSNLMAWLLDNDPVFKDINIRQDYTGKTLLILAINFDEINLVKLLLSRKGIDVNLQDTKHGATALHYAVARNSKKIVELLLKKDAINVNLKDIAHQVTPLYFAINNGHTEIAKLLLAHPTISINEKNAATDETALHLAAYKGLEEIAQLLLQKKADVNAKTADNGTPLYFATLASDKNAGKKVVELLLKEKNVDVNVPEKEFGRTPLWQAVFRGDLDIVKLLLAHPGIDVLIKDSKFHQTALEYARASSKDSEIIAALEQAEAQAGKKGMSSLEQLTKALSALKAKLSELAGKLHGMK